MADTDEGFELLPVATSPPDAEAQLALEEELATGTPAVAIPDSDPPPLGRAPAYDFAARRLLPGQAGGPLMTWGLSTLGTWIEKCLRTRRGENAACDPDFGVEIMPEDLLDGGPFDAGAVSDYEDAVRAGLLTHPRIADVAEFEVSYTEEDDAVFVSFRVVPEGDDLEDVFFDRLPLPLGANE